MVFKPHFLVASLGNPLPQYSSLHSAGHFALHGLVPLLQNPPLKQGTIGKALVSQGPKYTLVQSQTVMNNSGVFVARAWKEMLKQHDPSSLGLILLYDELEQDLGTVEITPWHRSHRGHNGIRSVKAHVNQKKFTNSLFSRIALGVGRPLERDSETVSDYLLSPISPKQKFILEHDVPPMIVERLSELEATWSMKLESQKEQTPV